MGLEIHLKKSPLSVWEYRERAFHQVCISQCTHSPIQGQNRILHILIHECSLQIRLVKRWPTKRLEYDDRVG